MSGAACLARDNMWQRRYVRTVVAILLFGISVFLAGRHPLAILGQAIFFAAMFVVTLWPLLAARRLAHPDHHAHRRR